MQLTCASASTTLSKDEVDLSFEDLCEELLALSASCSTLERMISRTEVELTSNSSLDCRKHTLTDRRRQLSGARPSAELHRSLTGLAEDSRMVQGQSSLNYSTDQRTSNISCGNIPEVEPAPDGLHQLTDTLLAFSNPTTSTNELRMAATSHEHRYSNGLRSQTMVNELGVSGISHEHGYSKGFRSEAMVITSKMTALTVDVGASHCTSNRTAVEMPIRGSLVTVTSPRSLLTRQMEANNLAQQIQRPQQLGTVTAVGDAHDTVDSSVNTHIVNKHSIKRTPSLVAESSQSANNRMYSQPVAGPAEEPAVLVVCNLVAQLSNV